MELCRKYQTDLSMHQMDHLQSEVSDEVFHSVFAYLHKHLLMCKGSGHTDLCSESRKMVRGSTSKNLYKIRYMPSVVVIPFLYFLWKIKSQSLQTDYFEKTNEATPLSSHLVDDRGVGVHRDFFCLYTVTRHHNYMDEHRDYFLLFHIITMR